MRQGGDYDPCLKENGDDEEAKPDYLPDRLVGTFAPHWARKSDGTWVSDLGLQNVPEGALCLTATAQATKTAEAVVAYAAEAGLPPMLTVEHGKPSSVREFVRKDEFSTPYFAHAKVEGVVATLADGSAKRLTVLFEHREKDGREEAHSRSWTVKEEGS
jgi:hypothetical protein